MNEPPLTRDHPRAQAPGDADRALRVAAPDVAGEPVDGAVRDRDRVGVVVVGDHREHRAEDLLLRERLRRVDVGEDASARSRSRRRDPRPRDRRRRAARPRPARPRRSPRRGRAAPSLMSGPMKTSGSVGSPYGTLRMPLDRELDALVEARPRDEQPRREDAALPGVEADERRGERDDRLEVGVVEDHVRRLAAELEQHALHRSRRGGHHRLAGRRRAGERDRVDARIGRQQRGDLGGRRRDDVEDAGRDLGALGDEPPEVGRRPGRERRRLEHDRAAGRERRADLREVELDRDVPRGDRADDADRLADEPAPSGPSPPSSRVVVRVALREVGVEAELLDRPVELVAVRHPHRAADLGDEVAPQRLGLVAHRLLQLAQARVRGAPESVAHDVPSNARSRGADRPLHVRGRAVGGDADLACRSTGRRPGTSVRPRASTSAPSTSSRGSPRDVASAEREARPRAPRRAARAGSSRARAPRAHPRRYALAASARGADLGQLVERLAERVDAEVDVRLGRRQRRAEPERVRRRRRERDAALRALAGEEERRRELRRPGGEGVAVVRRRSARRSRPGATSSTAQRSPAPATSATHGWRRLELAQAQAEVLAERGRTLGDALLEHPLDVRARRRPRRPGGRRTCSPSPSGSGP